MQIPSELVEQLVRKNVVLFVGAGLSIGAGLPGWNDIAKPLAERISYSGYDWLEAAQYYENREGRRSLISYLDARLNPPTSKPAENHTLIAQLPVTTVFTTNLDDLLEQAYRTAQKPVNRVVGTAELPFWDESKVNLVKLHGTLERPESIVFTREDYSTIYRGRRLVVQWLTLLLATKIFLFIGYSVRDPDFNQIYDTVGAELWRFQPKPYLVTFDIDELKMQDLQRRGFHIIHLEGKGNRNTALAKWLRALQSAVNKARISIERQSTQAAPLVGKLPYKFLEHFTTDDTDIFYGRKVQTQRVYYMTLSRPLFTLFGQSGVGKTSLLCAGLIPLLQAQGYPCAYVRTLGDPLCTIREDVCRALQTSCATTGALCDFFRKALGTGGRLVVILDQFEQFLTLASRETRRQFWRELRDCLNMQGLEVHFVICLRERYLADLDEARHPSSDNELAPAPDILRDSYRLTSLTTDEAHRAIVEPARHARCTVQQQLTDMLVGNNSISDLPDQDEQKWSLKEPDGSVQPPLLQIVMDRLYRQALIAAGHRPPANKGDNQWQPPELQIELDLYRELGGAARILADYVNDALDKVSERSGDRKLAETLLKVMVTSEGEKAVLDDDQMVREVAKASQDFDPDESQFLACLQITKTALVNLRLVHSFQVGERVLYELVHDHIAKEIAKWVNEDEMQAKLAHELLHREMVKWSSYGTLIEPSTLELIHERRDILRRLDIKELELLFRSALNTSQEITQYWAERAKKGNVELEQIIRDDLDTDDWRLRAAIAAKLRKVKDVAFVAPLSDLLHDLYPQVRVAAIHTLESYQAQTDWRALLDHLECEVYVPGGTFVMGDDDSDENNDKPQHTVRLGAFYAAKYPVTNREYKRYADDCGLTFELVEEKADHPVIGISWHEARDYARWADMRLLTEAEWEKAASWDEQSGAKHPFPWGKAFDKTRCNTRESGVGDTTPVGAYSERGGNSAYGCADMAGNVWEWTSSLYASYPYRSDDSRENEQMQGLRVLRGGSFFLDGALSRTVYRSAHAPEGAAKNIGFRLGLDSFQP